MNNLDIVYALRQRINRLENKLKTLTCENVHGNTEVNKQTVARICKIEARIIKLKGIHNDKIYQVYSRLDNRPRTASINNEMQMKISEIDIGDNITILKMTPIWFKLDDKKTALKNIIYPIDGTDRNLINTIARYRTIINKSKDFRSEPFQVNENSIETIIIALEKFIHQYNGEVCFTNEELLYSKSIEQTAYGIVNLGSIHLLAGNYIPTAKFSLKFNLNYDRDLSKSIIIMKNFIFDFNKSIAHLLNCKNGFIKIFSIEKINNRHDIIQINFGLTTPEKIQTISLAQHFQTLVRRSDFRNDKILRYIEPDRYRYELIYTFSYLQLSSKDFIIDHNIDYRSTNLFEQKQFENYIYYPPIGWFFHAINLNNKYFHDENYYIDNEWLRAYHGTHSQSLNRFIQDDILSKNTREKTIDEQEFYVTTHCNDAADLYTIPFTISNGDQNETFRIAFQCCVKPNSFTIHNDIVEKGEAWHIIDPKTIRPYGLLLKKDTILS